MTRPRIAQIPEATIKFSITDVDTSITLTSLKDSRGNAVDMATAFVPIGFATISPKTSSEEIISFTGITQNTDGSAELTGVTRNLAPVFPYTTLGAGDGHGAGTIVSFSNNPQLYNLYAEYIESIGVAGAPNASETTKGIVEVATILEIDDDEETGATGAILSIDPSRLHQSKYGQQLPSADEKAGISGLSAANKPVQNDSVTQSDIGGTLGEQTTSTNTIAVGEADATTKKNKLAQKFTATKTKMRGIELWKKANTGTFTGSVVITLEADNTGEPSGTPLATATFTNAQWALLTDNALFEALFATEYDSLVVGGDYWIVIDPSTSDNSNYANLGGRTSGGTGNVKYFNTTDGWVSIANTDLYFKVMEGNIDQIVKTNSTGKINEELYKSYSIVDLNNTETVVANTTTETSCYSKVLPKALKSTDGIKLTGIVNIYDDGSMVGGRTFRIKLNGTTVTTFTTTQTIASITTSLYFELILLNNSSLSSQKYRLRVHGNGTDFQEEGGANGDGRQEYSFVETGTSSIITGIKDTISFTGQNGVADTSDGFTFKSAMLEVIK